MKSHVITNTGSCDLFVAAAAAEAAAAAGGGVFVVVAAVVVVVNNGFKAPSFPNGLVYLGGTSGTWHG